MPRITQVFTVFLYRKRKARLYFYLLNYVTRRSEKLRFKKIPQILPNITTKLFAFGIKGNYFENYYFEISLRSGKLCTNYSK